MKASELVEHLKEMIDQHGDHEVIAFEWDIEDSSVVDGVDFNLPGALGPCFTVVTHGDHIPCHAFTPENEIPEWARGKVEAWKAERA